MHLLHMPIALPPLTKRLQTNPADMHLTVPTRDMIAPVRLLNRHRAHRTVLDVVLVLPLPKRLVALRPDDALVRLARQAVMAGDLARGADGGEAGGAGEDDAAAAAVGGDAVDVLAVRGGTVLERFGIRPDVRGEGVFEQSFERFGRERVLDFSESEHLCAVSRVAETAHGQISVAGRGALTGEAASAVEVTAGRTIGVFCFCPTYRAIRLIVTLVKGQILEITRDVVV